MFNEIFLLLSMHPKLVGFFPQQIEWSLKVKQSFNGSSKRAFGNFMGDSYNVFNFRTAQIDSVSPVAFNQLGKRRNMTETAKVKVKRTEIIEGRNFSSLKKCFLLF